MTGSYEEEYLLVLFIQGTDLSSAHHSVHVQSLVRAAVFEADAFKLPVQSVPFSALPQSCSIMLEALVNQKGNRSCQELQPQLIFRPFHNLLYVL